MKTYRIDDVNGFVVINAVDADDAALLYARARYEIVPFTFIRFGMIEEGSTEVLNKVVTVLW